MSYFKDLTTRQIYKVPQIIYNYRIMSITAFLDNYILYVQTNDMYIMDDMILLIQNELRPRKELKEFSETDKILEYYNMGSIESSNNIYITQADPIYSGKCIYDLAQFIISKRYIKPIMIVDGKIINMDTLNDKIITDGEKFYICISNEWYLIEQEMSLLYLLNKLEYSEIKTELEKINNKLIDLEYAPNRKIYNEAKENFEQLSKTLKNF